MMMVRQRVRCGRPRQIRRGFTLLELLLASVAAAMLLGALYMSFDMTLDRTQVARDAAATEDLVRGVFNRMAIDMAGVLGPQPPKSGGTANQQLMMATIGGTLPGSGSSSSSTSTTGATTGAASTSGASTSSTSSSSSSSSATGSTILGSGAYIAFECGVIGAYEGQPNILVLFTSRIPDMFTTTDQTSLAQMYSQGTASSSNMQYPADLRRVVYWLGNSGGLYRYETPWVTGEYTWNLSDLPIPDENGVLIAKEVKEVLFEFYDPYEMIWEQSWDGTGTSSPPYSLTLGPPTAIRVTLTFEFDSPRGDKKVRSTTAQIFPIYPAGGQVSQVLYDPTSSGGSSSSSSSSSSTGSSGGSGSAGK